MVELNGASQQILATMPVHIRGGIPEGGLKVTVEPGGCPDAERYTTSAVPLIGVTVTVAEMLPPARTVPEVGFTLTVKSIGTNACVYPLVKSIEGDISISIINRTSVMYRFDKSSTSPPHLKICTKWQGLFI